VQLMMVSHCFSLEAAVGGAARCWCWWERTEGVLDCQ
jgi:hypothetical protein